MTKTLPHRGFRFVADVISASERARDIQTVVQSQPERGPSLTVLPFSNLSVDGTYEFLADGLTEGVVPALSKLRGFFVTDRSTTFALKSEKTDPRKVAEEMGVLYILLGSVQFSGARIRVNPRLLVTETGSQLWSERYDRDLTDIFEVQDQLTVDLSLGPRDTFIDKSYLYLSIAKFQAGNYKASATAAEKAIQLKPGHPSSHMFGTAAFALADEAELAGAADRELLALVPHARGSQIQESVLYYQSKDRLQFSDGLRIAGLPE